MRVMITSGDRDDNDFLVAVKNLEQTALAVKYLEGLPKTLGARVLWSNGLVWRRVAPNGWKPEWSVRASRADQDRWWPSDHVAAEGDYTVLPARPNWRQIAFALHKGACTVPTCEGFADRWDEALALAIIDDREGT